MAKPERRARAREVLELVGRYLSTRVLVMSGRPGRIVADIGIPWDYPRPPQLRYAPEFGAITGRVSAALGAHS